MKERDEKATAYDSKIEQDAFLDGWDQALESEAVKKLISSMAYAKYCLKSVGNFEASAKIQEALAEFRKATGEME